MSLYVLLSDFIGTEGCYDEVFAGYSDRPAVYNDSSIYMVGIDKYCGLPFSLSRMTNHLITIVIQRAYIAQLF